MNRAKQPLTTGLQRSSNQREMEAEAAASISLITRSRLRNWRQRSEPTSGIFPSPKTDLEHKMKTVITLVLATLVVLVAGLRKDAGALTNRGDVDYTPAQCIRLFTPMCLGSVRCAA